MRCAVMNLVCFGVGIILIGIALSMFGSYVIQQRHSKYGRAIVITNSLLFGALAVIFVWAVADFVAALRTYAACLIAALSSFARINRSRPGDPL